MRAFQIIVSFHRWPLICSLSFAFLMSFTLETLSLPLFFAQEQKKKGTLIVYFCNSGASNFQIRDSWFVIFPSVNRARNSPRPLSLLQVIRCPLIKKLKLNILPQLPSWHFICLLNCLHHINVNTLQPCLQVYWLFVSHDGPPDIASTSTAYNWNSSFILQASSIWHFSAS